MKRGEKKRGSGPAKKRRAKPRCSWPADPTCLKLRHREHLASNSRRPFAAVAPVGRGPPRAGRRTMASAGAARSPTTSAFAVPPSRDVSPGVPIKDESVQTGEAVVAFRVRACTYRGAWIRSSRRATGTDQPCGTSTAPGDPFGHPTSSPESHPKSCSTALRGPSSNESTRAGPNAIGTIFRRPVSGLFLGPRCGAIGTVVVPVAARFPLPNRPSSTSTTSDHPRGTHHARPPRP